MDKYIKLDTAKKTLLDYIYMNSMRLEQIQILYVA